MPPMAAPLPAPLPPSAMAPPAAPTPAPRAPPMTAFVRTSVVLSALVAFDATSLQARTSAADGVAGREAGAAPGGGAGACCGAAARAVPVVRGGFCEVCAGGVAV